MEIFSPPYGDDQNLEVDSERRLSRTISRVLRRLRPSQLPEQRVVDRRHGWRKVGVVQNVCKGCLEPRMNLLGDSEPLCHTQAHCGGPGTLNDPNSCIPEATCSCWCRQEGQVVVGHSSGSTLR